MFFMYSGVLSVIVVWAFVVTPAIMERIDVKSKTISRTTFKKSNLLIINYGLRSGALLQLCFLIHLARKFHLSFLSPAVLLYFSTIIASLIVSFTPIQQNKTKHQHVAYYYFYVIPISLIIFGFSIKTIHYQLFLASIIIPLLYLIVMFLITKRFKKENALSEILAFSLLSIWTILVTFL